MRALLAVLALAPLAACPAGDDAPPVSPYPDLAVTGTVQDVRGGAVEGARVTIGNQYDAATATTGADGRFAMTIDGDDAASSIQIGAAAYRPYAGAVTAAAAGDLGAWGVMSRQEIVFSVYGDDADLWMVRADGTAPLVAITATVGVAELTPARSTSGLTLRWANATDGTVQEAAWDGSNPQVVEQVDADHALTGLAWGDRGTFVARRDQAGDTDIVIADDPPGTTFNYQWPGDYPDLSPPVFGNFGPQPVAGQMLAFAGGDGVYTAFPYFADSFLVPELVAGTQAADLYPRWSDYRADGSLDLALVRDGDLYVSHVTSDGETNVYSTPARVFGGGVDDPRANRFAWGLAAAGEPDELALAINVFSSGSTLAAPGDIVVIDYDHATGAVVGGPRVVYEAAAADSPGMALTLAWR